MTAGRHPPAVPRSEGGPPTFRFQGSAAAALCACAIGIATPIQASAAPTGPVSTPPGGGGYSGSLGGSVSGTVGGATYTYGSFDPTAYGSLYYTIGSGSGLAFSLSTPAIGMNGSLSSLRFDATLSNLAQGVAVRSGTTTANYFGPPTIATQFRLTVTDTSNNPLALTSASSLGVGFSGALLNVTGSFNANWQALALSPYTGTYLPARSVYGSLQGKPANQPNLVTSFGAGYHYTAAPVPEPAEWALMVAGLGLVGWAGRRQRRTDIAASPTVA